MDYHAARSGHSSPSLPLPLSSLHHLHQHHHNHHNSHHHPAQHHLMGLSQASAPALLPPPSSPSHPHPGLFYYPGLAVASKTPVGLSSSSSSLISASNSSSKLHVGNGTLHRRETLAVPPIPHPIALPPQPQQSSPHQAHLSLVTPGSSAEVSPPSGSSSRSNNNNGSGASVSGGSSSSSFAAALRHLAKQAGGPSGGSTSTAPPHVTANNSDAEGESLRSPSRNYGPVSGPGPGGGGGGGSNGGPSYPFLSSQSNNNGSTGGETASSRASSSGASGQARVKSSSPNESSNSKSASSGHRTNGGGVRNSEATGAASSDVSATKSSRQAHERERESGATNAVITRSRSPPVVTIAPTLSLTGLHYQDSRKAFERGPSSLAHAVPSSGASFGGGLSTGLSGLSAPLASLGASSLAGLVSSSGIVSYSAASAASVGAMAMGTSAPGPTSGFGIRTPDSLHSSAPTFHHALPSPFNPFQHSPRPEDVFYGGLRSVSGGSTGVQIPTSTCHFRPEDNPLAMIPPPHGLSLGINSSYHESLLAQLPSSRASTLTPQQQEEQYLMAARNSTYNPYSLPGVDHSALYHHPSFASASPYRLEEQLYLERYGLLRPSTASLAAPHGGISPYPPLPFPNPYLNFRYPSPLLHASADTSFAAGNLDSNLNRMKMEEELRLKERLREEERLTTPASSKSQDSSASSRPLATVPPRESSSSSTSSTSSSLQHSQRSQERRDKERSREREREKEKARERDRERDRQRRAEREGHDSELSRCPSDSALANSQMKSSRKLTVNLPSESTAVRGVKVHAVSPLSYSSAVHEPTSATMTTSTTIDIDKVEETAAQRPEEAVPTVATTSDRTRPAHAAADRNEIKGHNEFSYSALEAMAMLRHRITSPVVPVAAVAAVSAQTTEPVAVFDQDKGPSDSIPLDLSDSSAAVRIDESRQVHQQQQLQPPTSPPAPAQSADGYPFSSEACVTEIHADRVTSDQEQVRSVLDLRVERWRLKKEKRRKADQVDNAVSDAEDVDDLDEEVSQLNLGLPLNLGPSSSSLKSDATHRWPSVISEEQLNFLCLFGLITPQQRNDCELMKCMKRHNILRDPTPTPIPEPNDEDSATQFLKQRTTLALANCSQQLVDDATVKVEQEAPSDKVHFARSLALLPRDPCDQKSLEVSWKAVVADRVRRYFGRRDFGRKRLRNEAFRPIEVANGDESKRSSESDDPSCKKSRQSEPSISPVSSTSDCSDQQLMVNGIVKPITQPKNGFVHPHTAVPICQVPSLSKLELVERPNDWCNEATKLTSEVAFWLRHLTIPMARTLTSSSYKENSTSSIPVAIPKVNAVRYSEGDDDNDDDDDDESEDERTFESPATMMKWPGVDNLMVLYMASQQEYSNETKFLREHCERLHVQLAEGQATLSKLCLSLSSLVETQRKFKEEESLALQSISQLQTTLNMLHHPYK